MAAATVLTGKRRKAAWIPPLENGDHLTPREFMRRYEAMPEDCRAELIGGVVYMSSPVRIEDHGEQHSAMITWLGLYQASTPGVQAGDNCTVKLKVGRNTPQPDGLLRIRPSKKGQSQTTPKGYVKGAPEWAGEVAASTVSIDMNEKLQAYQKNGIREYLVWRVEDEEVDWFFLKGEKYQRLPRTKEGIIKSKVFPGLWLDAPALVRMDLAKVLEVLHQGLASPEHQAFVADLKSR